MLFARKFPGKFKRTINLAALEMQSKHQALSLYWLTAIYLKLIGQGCGMINSIKAAPISRVLFLPCPPFCSSWQNPDTPLESRVRTFFGVMTERKCKQLWFAARR